MWAQVLALSVIIQPWISLSSISLGLLIWQWSGWCQDDLPECFILGHFGKFVLLFHDPVGTCKVWYLEVRNSRLRNCKPDWRVCMCVSLQHWVRAESRYTNSNDDFQILEGTQEGIILALRCLFRNRFLFFVFFLTQNICTIPWNFLPIIATIWSIFVLHLFWIL